jgi:hypothetical protein
MEHPSIAEVLNNITQYASRPKAVDSQSMDLDTQDAALEVQLDDLISQFQVRIKKQQDELATVRLLFESKFCAHSST